MPAAGVISLFSKLHDVSFVRTDASPPQQGDVPVYETSASKLFMGAGGGGGGAGSFSLGVSTGGNTAGQTGVTATRVVLAGGGEITLSQVTDAAGATITASAPPQSAQTQNRFNLTLGGNTAGVLQQVSSGTLTLAGGNNITLSQNGNAVTVSAPASSVLSAVAPLSTATAGSTISILGPPSFSAGVSDSGNSAGATGVTGSRLVLVGSNNITLSQTTGPAGATISVFGTSGGGAQTFIGGISASDTLYTSGTVRMTGAGNITVASGTGQRVIISGSQSVQPETQTFVAGVGNSQTTYTSGTVRLSELGAVTIRSTTGQQLQISVNAQSVQPETQTFLGGIAASDTTYTSGTVRITGVGGGVTVSSNTGQRVDISVAAPVAQTVQTQNLHNVTLSGNTAGVMAQISSGTMTLAGGNNITVSQNGNAVTISGPNVAGAQTGISGLANSETTYTSGSVTLSALGALTIRSTTGQHFQLSVDPQSNQTLGMYALGNTTGQSSSSTFDARTVSLRGDGIVSLGYSNGSIRISASQSVQPETQTFIAGISASDTLYTSGNVRFTGVGGGITVSSNTGQRVDLSVAAPVAQTDQTLGLYALGNTVGESSSTTRDARTISFRGDGIVSLGYSNGSLRISASQSVQPETQTAISGIANSQTTYTSGTVSLSELGAITIRSTTGNQFQLSVAAQTAESQSFGMSNIGNTSGTTGIASGAQVRFLLAGGNNVTLSQSLNGASGTITISAASQSAESQSIGMSNVGNTSGTTGIASGAQVRMIFAGGNNITLSQSLNGASGTITISAPNAQTGISGVANSQTTYTSGTVSLSELGAITIRSTTGNQYQFSVNAQTAQTGISGIANSQTTYTSGTVSLSELGAITIRSTTGNQYQLSVNAQTVESQSIGMSNIGNTSGTTGIASGGQVRFLFAGGNNITLSQSLNGASGTITISAANAVETQTAISGIANSQTTYTSGTVSLSELGAITIRSTTGNQFQLSVNSQTAQTGISGLANSQTTYTSGTVSLSELGAITIRSTTGNQYQFSVNAQTGTQFSAGISGGNTAGDTGTVAGRVVLAGGANITLSGSTNGASETISIVGGGGGGFSAGVSTGGNTAGDTGVTGTRLVLVASNNLTASQATGAAGATVSIVGPSTLPVEQMTKAINQTTHGLAVGDWVRMSGTNYVKAQADNVVNAEVVGVVSAVADANNFTLTTGGFVSGLSGLTAGAIHYLSDVTAGAITATEPTTEGVISKPVLIANSTTSGYLFNMRGAVIDTDPTAFLGGVSNIGNSSGDTGVTGTRLVFAGGNNITLSQSTAAAGGTITISAAAGGAFSAGLSNIGNTAGDTVTVTGRVVLAGGNGITLSGSSNAGSQTITISGVTQSAESQSIGASNLGNTLGTSGVASGAQVRAVVIGTSNITVSQSVNGASATLSLIGQPSFSGGVSNLGNTGGATGVSGTRLVLVGSNNITLTQTTDANGATVSLFGQAPAGGQFSAGASNLGNTAGSTGITGTRLVWVGSNAISLSQSTDANGGTITINDTVSAFQAGVSTGGNTAGDTGVTGTRLVLVGSSPLSLSQATGANGGTVTINGPATSSLVGSNGVSISTNGSTISVLGETRTFFAPYDEAPMVTGQQGNQTIHVMPMYIPNVQFDRILLGVQISNATNSSNSITLTHYVGIYTKNASTLSLISSTSSSLNFSGSGTVGSYSLYGGPRQMSIPWTMTLTGSDYYIGINQRTTTGGGAGHSISQLCQSKFTNSDWSGLLGAASTVSAQRLLGQGVWSITSAGMPATMAFTDIRGSNSMVLRSPIFHFRSGTV